MGCLGRLDPRSWTDACLKVYGEIAVRNPEHLDQFEYSAAVPP